MQTVIRRTVNFEGGGYYLTNKYRGPGMTEEKVRGIFSPHFPPKKYVVSYEITPGRHYSDSGDFVWRVGFTKQNGTRVPCIYSTQRGVSFNVCFLPMDWIGLRVHRSIEEIVRR